MLKFFATGTHFNEKEIKPNKFTPHLAVPGKSGRLNERNYQDQFSHEFKSAAKLKHKNEDFRDEFKMQNIQHATKNAYFRTMSELHNDNGDKQKLDQKEPQNERDYNLQQLNHISNWKLVKEREFAFTHKKLPSVQSQGLLLSKRDDFETKKQGDNNQDQQKPNYQARENFYLSKPLLRLDKDFKDQPKIRNVQTISDDVPEWLKGANKYYTPENFDLTKKQKQKISVKSDIFGNKIENYPNNFQFETACPHNGLRYEKTRMVIVDKEAQLATKKLTVKEMKNQVNLGWKEQPEKQNYEYETKKKIGFCEKPFIKQLEEKRQFTDKVYSRVGEPEKYQQLDKDKLVQLKIGHGEPATINPLKYKPENCGEFW